MSPTDYDDNNANNEDDAGKPENWRNRLDQVKADRDKANTEKAALAKRVAIYEAGISGLSKDQLEAVSKLHDSDDLSADAIKATAERFGFVTPATAEEDVVTQDEIAAQQRVAAASAAGSSNASVDSPQAQLRKAYEEDGNEAGPNFYAKAQELGLPVQDSAPIYDV